MLNENTSSSSLIAKVRPIVYNELRVYSCEGFQYKKVSYEGDHESIEKSSGSPLLKDKDDDQDESNSDFDDCGDITEKYRKALFDSLKPFVPETELQLVTPKTLFKVVFHIKKGANEGTNAWCAVALTDECAIITEAESGHLRVLGLVRQATLSRSTALLFLHEKDGEFFYNGCDKIDLSGIEFPDFYRLLLAYRYEGGMDLLTMNEKEILNYRGCVVMQEGGFLNLASRCEYTPEEGIKEGQPREPWGIEIISAKLAAGEDLHPARPITDADRHKNYGLDLYGKERYSEAILFIEKSLAMQTAHPTTYFYLAKAYDKLGYSEEAIDACRRGLELGPKEEYLWYLLADLYEKVGRHEEAINAYIDTINLYFGGAYVDYRDVFRKLMNIYHHLGRDDEAEEAHKWVIELDENGDAIEEYLEKRRLAQRILR